MTTFADKNMTSKVLLASYTASGAELVAPSVDLTGLTNTAAVITLSFSITRGETEYPCGSYARAKETATDVVLSTPTIDVFSLDDGDVLNVYGLSSNAGDTAVGGAIRFDDVTGLTAGHVWGNETRTLSSAVDINLSDANKNAILESIRGRNYTITAIDETSYRLTFKSIDGNSDLFSTVITTSGGTKE